MRALVVGGAGSLGSTVVDRLLVDGAERVLAVDDLSSGRLDRLAAARATGRLAVQRFDVAEPGLGDLLARERPAVAVLCAALGQQDAVAAARALELGTARVLEACVRSGVGKAVLVVTAEVLGRGGPGAGGSGARVTERTRPAPRTAAGAAQAGALGWLAALRAEHGLPATALVVGEAHGPRRAGGVVARLVAQVLAGREPEPPERALDLVAQADVAGAVVRACGDVADGRRLLVGTGRAVPPQELVALVRAAAGAGGTGPEDGRGSAPAASPGRPVGGLALEPGGARRALGWEPVTGLEDGLAAVVAAHRRS